MADARSAKYKLPDRERILEMCTELAAQQRWMNAVEKREFNAALREIENGGEEQGDYEAIVDLHGNYCE